MIGGEESSDVIPDDVGGLDFDPWRNQDVIDPLPIDAPVKTMEGRLFTVICLLEFIENVPIFIKADFLIRNRTSTKVSQELFQTITLVGFDAGCCVNGKSHSWMRIHNPVRAEFLLHSQTSLQYGGLCAQLLAQPQCGSMSSRKR